MKSPLSRACLVLSALLIASPVWARGNVLVLDDQPGPGVDFTDSATAVQAAQEGDVLLFRDGNYDGFQLVGKSLTFLADAGANVVFGSPGIVIRDLLPGQSVHIRGIDITGVLGGAASLWVFNCGGRVWVEGCTIDGAGSNVSANVNVNTCLAVHFIDCDIVNTTALSSQNALSVFASKVSLYDCTLRAADATGTFLTFPANGGTGAFLLNSYLFASNTSFEGGRGTSGQGHFGCIESGNGGDALHVQGSVTLAETLGCTFTPGVAGPPVGPCGSGTPGQAVRSVSGGVHTSLSGTPRGFTSASPVREANSGQYVFTGQPGELVFASFSGLQGFLTTPFLGVLALGAPAFLHFEGVVSGAGTLQKSPFFPMQGAAVQALTVYVQPAFVTATTIQVGPPSAITILDSAF